MNYRKKTNSIFSYTKVIVQTHTMEDNLLFKFVKKFVHDKIKTGISTVDN